MDLRQLQADPARFRSVLFIDADGQRRRFGGIIEEWQRKDFLALDPAWRRVVGQTADGGRQRGWLERPRGHSKTADLAVMVVWALFASKRALRGYAAAADQDQAVLLRQAVDTLLRMNPWLGELLRTVQYKVVNDRTGSVLEILTSDAPTSYGLLPDFVVCDELVHWRRRDLWDSLASSAAKRRNCLLVVITNAGFQDSWQWELREAIRTDPAWYFSRIDRPAASWIPPDRLDEQRRLLPRIAFERLWLNRWSTGSGDALQPEDIDRAITLAGPEQEGSKGWRYVAGLDLGLRRDASALVVVGQHVGWYEVEEREPRLTDREKMLIDAGLMEPPEPERRERVVEGTGKLRVVAVDVWEPTAGQRVSIEAIEERIRSLDERFRFDAVAVDQWQAAHLCERLRQNGIPMLSVDFTPATLKGMATAVLEGFSERNVEMFNHPQLIADLRALRVEEKYYGIRLVPGQTPAGTRHGDAATALALALLAAKEKNRLVLSREPGILIVG